MLNKFFKLIRATPEIVPEEMPPPVKSDIEEKIDFLISSNQLSFVLSALQSGYEATREQSLTILTACDKSISNKSKTDFDYLYNYETRNSTAEKMIEHFIQYQPEMVKEYIANICNATLDATMEHIVNRAFAILDDAFLKATIDSYDKVSGSLSDIKRFNLSQDIKKVKDVYIFSLQKGTLLSEIKEKYQIRAVPNLPSDVELKVKIINQSIRQIEIDYLSEDSKAQLRLITEKSIPEVLKQYASIDPALMQYKNDNNETIDFVLKENLKAITSRLGALASEAKDAEMKSRMKDIQVSTRHLASSM